MMTEAKADRTKGDRSKNRQSQKRADPKADKAKQNEEIKWIFFMCSRWWADSVFFYLV